MAVTGGHNNGGLPANSRCIDFLPLLRCGRPPRRVVLGMKHRRSASLSLPPPSRTCYFGPNICSSLPFWWGCQPAKQRAFLAHAGLANVVIAVSSATRPRLTWGGSPAAKGAPAGSVAPRSQGDQRVVVPGPMMGDFGASLDRMPRHAERARPARSSRAFTPR
jgi:hypothetical protein